MDALVCCVSIYPWELKDMLHTIDAICLSSMLLLLKLLGLLLGLGMLLQVPGLCIPKILLFFDCLKDIVTF